MGSGIVKLLLSVKRTLQAGVHKCKMKGLCKPLSVEGVQLQETKSSFLHLLVFILFHLLKFHLLCLPAFLTVSGCATRFSAPGRGEHSHKDREDLDVLSFLSDPKKKSAFTFCDSNKQDRKDILAIKTYQVSSFKSEMVSEFRQPTRDVSVLFSRPCKSNLVLFFSFFKLFTLRKMIDS